MPGPDHRVAELAATQWGVVSLADLRRCGLSRDAVATRVRTGRLHRVHHGVYAVGHARLPFEGRLFAANVACGPSAAVSHLSAAAVFGFIDPDDRHPEVTVVGATTRVHPGIRVHRTQSLLPEDVCRHGALTITSPARTIIDLAPTLDPAALRRITGQAQSLRRTNTRELLAALQRLRPRRGSRALTQLLAAGPAPTRSALEDIVLELILSGGFAHPQVNAPVFIARPPPRSGLPLARTAAGDRSGQRGLARRRHQARGRRRTPGAPGGPRRARLAHHLEPGHDRARPDARSPPGRGRAA